MREVTVELWKTAAWPDRAATIVGVGGPDHDEWYFEHVLIDASPGAPPRRELGPAALWRRWWRQLAIGPEPLATAAAQGFVLDGADLRRLAVSRSATRTAVRHGRWVVPARGVIAPLDVADESRYVVERRHHALTATAAVLHRPHYAVSGRSAAILDGLPTFTVPPRPELTAVAEKRLGRRSGAHVLGAQLPNASVTRWFGAPVTTVARTLVDLGRHDRRDALMAADAALRQRLVTATALADEVDRAAGWPGIVSARAVLALANGQAESPLESLTRLALHDSGFPPPALQFEIGGFRVDLCWPDRRLIVEADGREKYSGDALWNEKRREAALRSLGFRVERVVWSDVVRDWPATRERVRAAYWQ